MPRPSTSTLSRPSASRSSLSHWMTVRSGIAAFSTGTSSSSRSRAITKPPTCCDRWRGNPSNVRASVSTFDSTGLVGIEPRLAHATCIDVRSVPPLHRARERRDLQRVEAHRLGHVAQRTARPVTDDRGRKRGAMPAVLAVDVLDDLLAPLVLEVHVDVGRLVALLRDEALEQQRHARRIHLGDAEAEADGGIGRGAAPLAQDAARAREPHDVVHGQEVRLRTPARRSVRVHARWPARSAPARRRASDCACLPRSGAAASSWACCPRARSRADIRSAVRRARTCSARRCRCVASSNSWRMQLGDARDGAQVTLAVRKQSEPGLVHRRAETCRREHVLQRTPAAGVHVHIAGGDEWQVHLGAKRLQCVEPPAIAAGCQQFYGEPEPPGKHCLRATALLQLTGRAPGSQRHRQSSGPGPAVKSLRVSRYSPFGAARRPRVIKRQSCP